VGINPLTSFTYKDVGVNVTLKAPRVTYTGDIIMELSVESSNRGRTSMRSEPPVVGTRKVTRRPPARRRSNLLAGLLRKMSESPQGFPARFTRRFEAALPATTTDPQTDIVMLLTPHIVRTHEVTESDLKPIYIGTGANPNLGGPPPLIGQPAAPPAGEAAAAPPGGGAGAAIPGAPKPGVPVAPTPPTAPVGTPVPGVIPPQPAVAQPPAQPPGAQPPPGAQATPPAAQPPAAQPAATPPAAAAAQPAAANVAQVMVSSPSAELRVGGGPYTVVVSISDASRVSTVSFSMMFNPNILRVRGVNQGSFMSQGGLQVAFAQQVDSVAGRVDITLTRTGDTVGASGTGSLAVVLFDAVAAGKASLNVSGVATGPGGTPIALKVTPAEVTVR
jgi:hypothetical protein